MASMVERSGGLFSHKLLTNAPALARCVHVVTVDTFAFHKSLTNAPALTSSPRGPLNVQPVLTRIRIMKKEKKSLRESLKARYNKVRPRSLSDLH